MTPYVDNYRLKHWEIEDNKDTLPNVWTSLRVSFKSNWEVEGSASVFNGLFGVQLNISDTSPLCNIINHFVARTMGLPRIYPSPSMLLCHISYSCNGFLQIQSPQAPSSSCLVGVALHTWLLFLIMPTSWLALVSPNWDMKVVVQRVARASVTGESSTELLGC